jgi:hypothetical protein
MHELKAHFVDLDDVQEGLQAAIELELALIPPYLSALWSIKDRRSRAAQLILNVVVEEMLHMALAANILNAIGGAPRLLGADVVPAYPCPLPGQVQEGVVVRLRRCDRAQLEVFKTIETPENPVDVRSAAFAVRPVTVGQFYDGITDKLQELGPRVFTGDPGRQLRRWPTQGELRPVSDLDDARWAIETIKEQGEGASQYDPNDRDGELGHYYLFWEILEGREIVRRKRSWAFAGDVIPFPDTYPVVDDPTVESFADGSQQRALAEQFNGAYCRLLRGLDRTFNGEPDHLDAALGVMYALRVIALDLYKLPSGRDDGTVAGPPFQLLAEV